MGCRISGIGASAGCAQGRVHLFEPGVPHAGHAPEEVDIAQELTRLRSAMGAMQDRIDRIVEANLSAGCNGRGEVLDAYCLFTRSPDWQQRLEDTVRTGMPAEDAVKAVQAATLERFICIQDVSVRDWLGDLHDLANELVLGLLGIGDTQCSRLAADAVVVARDLDAGAVLRLGARARAFVLEEGAEIAPAAIVAASMGTPMVVQAGGILAAADHGDRIVVNADHGTATLRPDLTVVEIGMGARRRPQAALSGGSDDLDAIKDLLGPDPAETLTAMAAYGLSDHEIARYYGLDMTTVKRLRRAHAVERPVSRRPEH